ncbi:MAG: hypothetical protein QXV23_06975 [Candidatus Bathyarchaeia archaeon]
MIQLWIGGGLMDKDNGLKRLVYIRYRDHVLFRNSNHSLLSPIVRETVGWIVRESDDALWILWDKSADKSEFSFESGLIILRSDVLEKRNVRVE